VVMVMVSQLTLALLGSSIGLSAVDLNQGNNLKTLGVGAIFWWIISGMVSFYIGGLVSGRMCGIPRRLDGIVHGLLTWGLTTILMFLFLTTTVGAMVAGGFGLLKSAGQAVSSAAPQIANTVKDVMPQQNMNGLDNIRNEVRQILDQRGGGVQNPAVRDQLMNAIRGLATSDNPDAQKRQIVTLLTQNTNINEQDAINMVNRWSQSTQMIKQDIQQGVQKAQDAAESASKAAGKGAFASFAMLLLGALVAGFGGAAGAPHWSEQEIT
jgi:hypothetical protein